MRKPHYSNAISPSDSHRGAGDTFNAGFHDPLNPRYPPIQANTRDPSKNGTIEVARTNLKEM